MKRLTLVTHILLLTLFEIKSVAQTNQQRIALVIGAQNYKSVPPLRHSLNDARDLSTILKTKGFNVITVLDPPTKKEIKDGITQYFRLMQSLDDGVGFIFYAGHGMQNDGDNYLIPINANLQNPGDLDDQCVKLNYIMSTLRSATKSLNIVVLDACRTGFNSFSRDATISGLTKVEAPRGSIVIFAAEPGKTASDGTGRNGMLTATLLKHINDNNINANEVFRRVKNDVFKQSNETQLPMLEDASTGGDFYFTQGANNSTTQSPANIAPAISEFDYGYGTADAPRVKIGTQEWLSKNLNVDHFANGDPIPEAKTEEDWKRAGENKQPAWCYYNNDLASGRVYGKLYNWYAVSDPRGLAPKGWHVPSDNEWDVLIKRLAGRTVDINKPHPSGNAIRYSTDRVSKALKSVDGWNNYGNGTNTSGITGRPGGGRNPTGSFDEIGHCAYWWSSSDSGEVDAWCRFLFSYSDVAWKSEYNMACGYSVRCVKD
jgi:uncharacterized protein (TIGR02145 family)